MKTSIATVCLSGGLSEKLEAIAAAGFRGVEIFESDLLSYNGSPADVAKEVADLHTDQLSQAVLLEFAESGRLEAHRKRMRQAGSERLAATLEACARYLPAGTRWTKPEGGMNVWVRLPEPLDAGELLARAQRAGVAYMPGRYFAVSTLEPGALRLSFAGLTPEQIREGLAILGRTIGAELENAVRNYEPSPAMV